MNSSLPSTFQGILFSFQSCFTAPTFLNFVALVTGWVLCQGRHSVSRVIQAAGELTNGKDHSVLYRFFSRAKWSADAVGNVLFRLFLPFLGKEIFVLVDDTLCRKSGPHLFGAGMHHDASRSTYGRGSATKRHVSFTFGRNWVVLAVWFPLPWNPRQGKAVPLLACLYRSKKHCPQDQYRKRTELAAGLIKTFTGWLPEGYCLHVVGDSEYACKTVVQSLPQGVRFTGSMHMKAALYKQPGAYQGKGRPRKKGERLASPTELAASNTPWQTIKPALYGKPVTILCKTRVCLWYSVAGVLPIRMVLTRDPKGRLQDRAFFSTDTKASVEELLVRYARRWEVEVSFREAKQLMRVEDPQNGWWRRKQGTRKPKKRSGPQPRGNRGRKAAEHTLPLAFTAYGIVLLWYLRHGKPEEDVAWAKAEAPWYRHKQAPSFEDMLAALRRELWASRLRVLPLFKGTPLKFEELRTLLPRWLLAA